MIIHDKPRMISQFLKNESKRFYEQDEWKLFIIKNDMNNYDNEQVLHHVSLSYADCLPSMSGWTMEDRKERELQSMPL